MESPLASHFSAEVALEAWALLQADSPMAPVAPATALAASLPNLRSGDVKETLELSHTCPGYLPEAAAERREVPLLTLEQTLQRSGKGGDVHFIHFWRSLGEVSLEAQVSDGLEASNMAEHTLPIGPLGPAEAEVEGPARWRPSRRPFLGSSVTAELEELRDVMLDHFEAAGGQELPMETFYAEVQSLQLRSKVPKFWEKLSSQLGQDREAGECLDLSQLTVFLLLWLREAAACDLTAGVDAETSPASEDLSMLAEHLQQALDVPRSHQSTAGHPTEGYESTAGPGTREPWGPVRPNLRSAMLSLNGEVAELQAQEGARGWMRSALLPRSDVPDQIGEDETVSLPASRQPGLREAASPADPNGDLGEGWKQLMPTADDFARTAMRTVNPLPELEQIAPRRMPVLLHIYDVTQEPAIQRLNKVLAHKRMPLKFGGIFHAGVEVSGTEWSYGCTESEDEPGVLPNLPKMHPDHHYRQTVEMRRTNFSASEVGDLLEELSIRYTGPTYDLLRQNCCHFADDFCQRLGAGGIPAWVYRLARIASRIESLLQAAQRIRTG
mmetsp:Transcript_44966/g.71463  ORF Transcript_44966/g.71463 Transcript_44966/m.71463 type:complete len:555 (+) Transcript_44966:42-1706(+)